MLEVLVLRRDEKHLSILFVTVTHIHGCAVEFPAPTAGNFLEIFARFCHDLTFHAELFRARK